MCGSPTPCTTRWGVSPPSRRCASPSPTTGGASGRAASAPWPSTRGGSSPPAATRVSSGRQSCSSSTRASRGYIHDVGGPSATFRHPSCQKQLKHGLCKNRACLAPEACPNLDADHTDYMMLLRKLRELPGVKKVFIRSGIRFDYLMKDPSGGILHRPGPAPHLRPAEGGPGALRGPHPWTTWASPILRCTRSSGRSTSSSTAGTARTSTWCPT